MSETKKENIVVLIDVQNLYHSSVYYGGSKVSYKKLMEKITAGRNLLQAKAYAAHKDGKSTKAFYKALDVLGIKVSSKYIHLRKVENQANPVKVIPVHFDVEISVDALCAPQETNTIVLCSGNGNFEYLVDQLMDEGMNVEVWSFKESTSERLIKKAKFVQIPKECLLSTAEEEKVEKVQTA